MNYVYYGMTFAGNKQFRDNIMQQDEFVAKYGKPNANGWVKINDELYNVYLMNFSLHETMKFAVQYRELFISNGFTEI
jgi:hypothetical protein